MDYSYYYTKISYLIDDVIEEKGDMLVDLFQLIIRFNSLFFNNSNLKPALKTIYNYIISMLIDINREHDIYLYINEYLGSLEEPSKLSKSVLVIIEDILNKLEETVDKRLLDYAEFLNYFDSILEGQILTNMNYYYPNYQDTIPEEEKNRLLSLLSKKNRDNSLL